MAPSPPLSPSRFLPFFACLTVFGLLPIGFFFLVGRGYLHQEEQEWRRQAQSQLTENLRLITRELEPGRFFHKRFNRFFQRLQDSGFSPHALERLRQRTAQAWSCSLEACLFDAHGKLISLPQTPIKSRFIVQKLWDSLRRVSLNTSPAASSREGSEKALEAYLGKGFQVAEAAGREGVVIPVSAPTADALLYWKSNPRYPLQGLLLICRDIPPPITLLERVLQHPLPGSLMIRAIPVQGPPREFGATATRPSSTPATIHARFVMEQFTLEGRRTLPVSPFSRAAAVLYFGTGIALIVSFWFWRRWFLLGKPFRMAVSTKLLALFFAATGIPTLGVLALGQTFMQDQQAEILTEAQKSARSAFKAVDQAFDLERLRFGRNFRALQQEFLDTPDIKRLETHVSRLLKQKHLTRFEIRGTNGDQLFRPSGRQSMAEVNSIFDGFARACLDRRPGNASHSAGPFAALILNTPEMAFSSLLDQPGQPHYFRLGAKKFYWCWNVLPPLFSPETATAPAYLSCFQHVSDVLESFLRRRIPHRYSHQDTVFRLAVFRRDRGVFLPREYRNHPGLERLVNLTALTLQDQHAPVRLNGSPFWAFAGLGNHLEECVLVALLPQKALFADIERSRQYLWAGVGLILVLCWFSALVLARHILRPVAGLGQGVHALARREMSFRLHDLRPDEFGDLGRVFNDMMEELTEKDMAREVQDLLIPATAPSIPGCELSLTHCLSGTLGGDYCDILPVGDDQVFLLAGETSRRGVTGALMMGMLKAEALRFARRRGPLSDFFDRVGELTRRHFPRTPGLSLFAGLYSPATRELVAGRTGSSAPWRIHPDGSSSILEPKPPAAEPRETTASGEASAVSALSLLHERLAPGEWLVIFTSGLWRSTDSAGQSLATEAVRRLLIEQRHQKPEHLADQLLTHVCRHLGRPRPAPDSTATSSHRNKPRGRAPEKTEPWPNDISYLLLKATGGDVS